jgi:hypothetical protein
MSVLAESSESIRDMRRRSERAVDSAYIAVSYKSSSDSRPLPIHYRSVFLACTAVLVLIERRWQRILRYD